MKTLNTTKIVGAFCAFLFFAAACSNEKKEEQEKNEKEEQENKRYDLTLKEKLGVFAVLPSEAPNENNVANADKIKLGHLLFFDKRLSKNNTISCNSCHDLSTSGVDNKATSPGDAGEFGGRNSPTVLNAAFHQFQFWDGRAKDVEEQAGMPILNPVEMAIPSEDFLVKRLKDVEMYRELFQKAFPGEKQSLTYGNIAKAIAVFERQLITPSRFDDYLKGNSSALTLQEKKGLSSFINIGCVTCHSGALLGGMMFQKFGVYEDYWKETGSEKIDLGRFEVTKEEADKYVFKASSLRNVAETQPYFHDGSVNDLKKAIEIMAKIQNDYRISPGEVDNIAAFLESLSGDVPDHLAKEPEELKK